MKNEKTKYKLKQLTKINITTINLNNIIISSNTYFLCF